MFINVPTLTSKKTTKWPSKNYQIKHQSSNNYYIEAHKLKREKQDPIRYKHKICINLYAYALEETYTREKGITDMH